MQSVVRKQCLHIANIFAVDLDDGNFKNFNETCLLIEERNLFDIRNFVIQSRIRVNVCLIRLILIERISQ